jgi:hypothetical protein
MLGFDPDPGFDTGPRLGALPTIDAKREQILFIKKQS